MAQSNPRETVPLSLPACRRLLGQAGDGISDEELVRLRDQLYAFARCAVTEFERSASDKSSEVNALDCLPSTAREEVEERAAVIQFDAHLPREWATRAALSAHLTTTAKKGD